MLQKCWHGSMTVTMRCYANYRYVTVLAGFEPFEPMTAAILNWQWNLASHGNYYVRNVPTRSQRILTKQNVQNQHRPTTLTVCTTKQQLQRQREESQRTLPVYLEIHYLSAWKHTTCLPGNTLPVCLETHYLFAWKHTTCLPGNTLPVYLETHYLFAWKHTTCLPGNTLCICLETHYLKHSTSPSHSILTPGWPVPVLTL